MRFSLLLIFVGENTHSHFNFIDSLCSSQFHCFFYEFQSLLFLFYSTRSFTSSSSSIPLPVLIGVPESFLETSIYEEGGALIFYYWGIVVDISNVYEHLSCVL